MKELSLYKIIGIAIAIVLSDFFLFPVQFSFLPPGTNTKMLMALCGLILLGYRIVHERKKAIIPIWLLKVTLWSIAVSIIAFISITYNNTNDTTFTSFFMSVWVWLGAAYLMVMFIKAVHGSVSIKLIGNYLIAVCTIQCIIAIFFSFYPEIDKMITTYIVGEAYMGDIEDRMHGIGVALDVSGLKFSAVLFICIYLIGTMQDEDRPLKYMLYMSCYCTIFLIGNMISRTTTLGCVLSIIYFLYLIIFKSRQNRNIVKSSIVLLFGIAISIILFNNSPIFKTNMEFGFEGFFSLAKTGKWQTNSTDILNNMVVFPDNAKTWIIGDGYAENPTDRDPHYIGPAYHGYYKGTDIGYLRYIFYFGIIGLLLMVGHFLNIFGILYRAFPGDRLLFTAILLINFIGWIKVSSDIFSIFAPFLCLSSIMDSSEKEDDDEPLLTQ